MALADDTERTAQRSFTTGERVEMVTVGIDIGSATSQLVLSRLVLTRRDDRFQVTSRGVIHESPVALTPYLDAVSIDTDRLAAFVEDQYHAAAVGRQDVDSGVVILTGLALATDNSRRIGDLFADTGGRFVAVSAGDRLEATLAARGCGVLDWSAAGGSTIVHIDIGGGTTKYNLVRAGEIERTAAIDVGARLLVHDPERRLIRLAGPAARAAERLDLRLEEGQRLPTGAAERIAEHLAGQILAHAGIVLGAGPDPALLRTEPLWDGRADRRVVDALYFSGGVSEYLADGTGPTFGDLGPALANGIRAQMAAQNVGMTIARRGIRATVLGASQYSVQLSGPTVSASPSLLPLRNLPVVKPRVDLGVDGLGAGDLTATLTEALADAAVGELSPALAVALPWAGSATFPRVSAVAESLVRVQKADGTGRPLVAVFDRDVGALIGRRALELGGADLALICIDGVDLSDLDFLDVGEFVAGTGALPVVVKSLVFPPPAGQSHERPEPARWIIERQPTT